MFLVTVAIPMKFLRASGAKERQANVKHWRHL
jgi:hypothetical protein